jgi:hypothetical protein
MEVLEVSLQARPVGRPRHPVHSRCGLGAYPQVGRIQTRQGDMVQQRREPRIFIFSCCFTHTF